MTGEPDGEALLRRARARGVAIRHERATHAAVALLEGAGVDVLVLKGVATAELLYPDRPRPSADIDLLVPPGDFRRARRALRRVGYRRIELHGHAECWRPTNGTDIDLHITLPWATVPPRVVWSVLNEQVRRLALVDGSVPCPGREAMVVHLSLHAAQSWGRPGPMEDLRRARELLDRDTWDRARAVADRLGVADAVEAAWEGRRPDLPPRRPDHVIPFDVLGSPVHRSERRRAVAGMLRRQLARRNHTPA